MNRDRLKNKDFSILSSNCLGGLLYHEYRLPFLTPTINTRISSNEFIRLILNWDEYLGYKIEKVNTDERFPVGKWGDVIIRFVHYHNYSEAVETWNRRIKRINYDNIFVLLNDCDGVGEKEILELQENSAFHNICVFTSCDYGLKTSFYLPCFKNEKCVGNTMQKSLIDGRMIAEKYFDFVGWFNQEKGTNLESYRI